MRLRSVVVKMIEAATKGTKSHVKFGVGLVSAVCTGVRRAVEWGCSP